MQHKTSLIILFKRYFMKLFIIGLGSNIGEREQIIMQAIALIGERIGTVEAQSSLYQTQAEGFESDNLFVNAVITVHSTLEPHEVLSRTHQIELDLGCSTHRNDDGTYCDRSLDIDLIACDDIVCCDEILTLPHPRMHLRNFVLDPLCEIAPQWIHPTLHRTATQLREDIK